MLPDRPSHHPKPDRLFPTSNNDRTLTTHKTRSPILHIKAAITNHHSQNQIA
ncbi:MAG: hypothetical protein ACK5BG_07270 [Pseudanabaena sp.]|nr:hypothetical protein [Pseudanabaena sp. 42896M_M3]